MQADVAVGEEEVRGIGGDLQEEEEREEEEEEREEEEEERGEGGDVFVRTARIRFSEVDYSGGLNAPLVLLRAAKFFEITGTYPQELAGQTWFERLKHVSPASWLRMGEQPVFGRDVEVYRAALSQIAEIADGPLAKYNPTETSIQHVAVGLLLQVLGGSVFDITKVMANAKNAGASEGNVIGSYLSRDIQGDPEVAGLIASVVIGFTFSPIVEKKLLASGHAFSDEGKCEGEHEEHGEGEDEESGGEEEHGDGDGEEEHGEGEHGEEHGEGGHEEKDEATWGSWSEDERESKEAKARFQAAFGSAGRTGGHVGEESVNPKVRFVE